MVAIMKRAVRRIINLLGYDYYRLRPGSIGSDPYIDIRGLLRVPRPIVFDVGANHGDTVRKFQKILPASVIHAFEPSPDVFRTLETSTRGMKHVFLNNVALGSKIESRTLRISTLSGMTSLLEPGNDYWGEVSSSVPVSVITLDQYCTEHQIDHVDVIKLDTQGFDVEVLRGGMKVLREGRIHLVLIEIIFNEIYEGCANPEEVLSFMRINGFRLVTLYQCHLKQGFACWADALFISNRYASQLPTVS